MAPFPLLSIGHVSGKRLFHSFYMESFNIASLWIQTGSEITNASVSLPEFKIGCPTSDFGCFNAILNLQSLPCYALMHNSTKVNYRLFYHLNSGLYCSLWECRKEKIHTSDSGES